MEAPRPAESPGSAAFDSSHEVVEFTIDDNRSHRGFRKRRAAQPRRSRLSSGKPKDAPVKRQQQTGHPTAIERYLKLPYHLSLSQDDENGGEWLASVEELPGCASRGESPEKAVGGVQDAMAAWIDEALKKGKEIPEPRSPTSHSGRLLLRMPRTLHAELTRVAERENVSLNQFITDSLASTVGWRAAPGAENGAISQEPGVGGLTAEHLAAAEVPGEAKRSWQPSRLVTAALTANFVIVAAASVVAILVLIAAWQ